MSCRNLSDSGRIEQRTVALDLAHEIRIGQRTDRHEVDGSLEQIFQSMQEAEVVVSVFDRLEILELHERVEVTTHRVETAGCSGTEELQPADMVPQAQPREFFALVLDQNRDHGPSLLPLGSARKPSVGQAVAGHG